MENPSVIILCGVSGSGKTHNAKRLFDEKGGKILSADTLFISKTGYHYDKKKLPEAHGACLREFVAAVLAQVPHIIVDNTNTRVTEIAPYAALALAYGRTLKIVTILCDPKVAHARNMHGVPLAMVERMAQQLNARQMPPWWPHEIIKAA